MIVNNKFAIEQIVYLKTDNEQNARIVKSIQIFQNRISYNLVFGITDSWHDDFEITTEPTIIKTKDAEIKGFKN